MKKYYHATHADNLGSILNEGIHIGIDNIVYLAETREDALKFIAIRLIGQPIVVIEVEIPDDEEKYIKETFDHSYNFFKCRSFGYSKDIPTNYITDAWKYE